MIRSNISPNSVAARRKVNGRMEAHIIQIACGPVPGGHAHWILRLLEENASHGVGYSHRKRGHPPDIKKMNFYLTAMNTGVSRQKKMQNL